MHAFLLHVPAGVPQAVEPAEHVAVLPAGTLVSPGGPFTLLKPTADPL